MTESLSEDDILSLINNISTNDQGDIFDQGDITSTKTEQGSYDSISYTKNKNHNIKLYDFKGPDKFSKDQLRTIQMIHENFSRSTTTFLSTYLRKSVSIHVSYVDQIAYEQFIKAVSSPTTLAIIDMSPLSSSIILEISPTITFVIIDRIFGGDGDILRYIRELSDIELSVINGMIIHLLSGLREAWSAVVDVYPRLEKIESDIQFTQIVSSNDTVILVSLDVQIGDIEGTMMFCLPYIALDSIMSKLTAKSIYGTYKNQKVKEKNNIFLHVLDMPLDLSLILSTMTLSMNKILSLKEGDYLPLTTKKNNYLNLMVGNDIKFKAEVGKIKNKLVAKVVSIKKTKQDTGDMKNFNIDSEENYG